MTFSRLQIFFVVILFVGISNHVLILPHLLGVAKRDAWISAIFAYVIILVLGFFIFCIMKSNKEKLILSFWIERRVGKFVSLVITLLFAFFILLTTVISFYDLMQSVNIYFLPLTSPWMIIVPFLLISVWASYNNLRSIVYISTILLPIVVLLGYFVAFATMGEKDYSFIFPVLVDGYGQALKGTILILGGGVEILVLLFLQPYLKQNFTYLQIIILITFLTGLIFGPTLGSLSAFGPNVASAMRFPAFEQWRLITLGEHISHVDFLAVFQFLAGCIIRISLGLFIVTDIVSSATKFKKKTVLFICSFILLLFTLLPISDILFLKIVGQFFYPITVVFGISVTLILWIFSFITPKKGPYSHEQ
ncbi:GerAB/ArcD/ProY family transporter [Sutcliffiella sp. NC1]|uniref:GerAB/ArcD/ProY family transporter n=1 Tax=Sutcliffiella sp. NC1 TaxID=3004096 RepID=UPI0022DD51C0|nr:endospore germination permease [Sutcliffiella sp. NC1]WBL12885.1 endospore germination permease [Sutcliffiella sp. NC1]